MRVNEYRINGEVTYRYPVLVVNDNGTGIPKRIVPFDVSTDVWSAYTHSMEKTELHFEAGGGLADDALTLMPGDKVELSFSIKGFFRNSADRVLFNKLSVRSMRIVKDYDFDIERWRMEQRKEMSDGTVIN